MLFIWIKTHHFAHMGQKEYTSKTEKKEATFETLYTHRHTCSQTHIWNILHTHTQTDRHTHPHIQTDPPTYTVLLLPVSKRALLATEDRYGLVGLHLLTHQLIRHALSVGVDGRGPPQGPPFEHAELLCPPLVRCVTLQAPLQSWVRTVSCYQGAQNWSNPKHSVYGWSRSQQTNCIFRTCDAQLARQSALALQSHNFLFFLSFFKFLFYRCDVSVEKCALVKQMLPVKNLSLLFSF